MLFPILIDQLLCIGRSRQWFLSLGSLLRSSTFRILTFDQSDEALDDELVPEELESGHHTGLEDDEAHAERAEWSDGVPG